MGMEEHIVMNAKLSLQDVIFLLRIYWEGEAFTVPIPIRDRLHWRALIVVKGDRPSGYAITPKGITYCEAIRDLPMPVEETKWVMPKEAL